MSTDHVIVGNHHEVGVAWRLPGRPASRAGVVGEAMSRLLVEQPGLNEVSRLVVALLSVPLSARGARVTIASDGVGICAVDLRDRLDLARAVDGLQGGAPVKEKETDHVSRTAAIVLGSDVVPLGSLAVCMNLLTSTAEALKYLRELSQPLAVYAAGLLHEQPCARGTPVEPHLPTADPGSLSSRQRQVLSALSEGLTIAQIALRLRFSDSTIRAETLAIYRHLGVHNRDDAVQRARGAGLLDDAPPPTTRTEGSQTMSA